MKRMEKEMTPEMNIPEEGVVYKSDMKAKNYFMLEGESIPYYYMTKEQADVFLEAVKNVDFTPQRAVEDEIIEIIMEELSPYLYRTKTLQEVTQIIQNRIQMIVQEMV